MANCWHEVERSTKIIILQHFRDNSCVLFTESLQINEREKILRQRHRKKVRRKLVYKENTNVQSLLERNR